MYLEKQYITAEFLPKSNRSSKYEIAIQVFLTKEANTANSYSLGFNLDKDKIDEILTITEVIKLTSISKSIKKGSKKKPVNVNIENSKYYKKLDYIRTITNKPIII